MDDPEVPFEELDQAVGPEERQRERDADERDVLADKRESRLARREARTDVREAVIEQRREAVQGILLTPRNETIRLMIETRWRTVVTLPPAFERS